MFTAHEHKSMIINIDSVMKSDRHIIPVNANDYNVFKYTLGNNDMYEILVPTCSYRMGTSAIGYGYAIIGM